jgi:hypothetical protein
MVIPLFVKDDIRLGSDYTECWVPYPGKCRRIVYVPYHYSRLGSWAEFSMLLHLGDKSTGVAAESPKVVERSLVRAFFAINVM